jgi:uncharacterized protein
LLSTIGHELKLCVIFPAPSQSRSESVSRATNFRFWNTIPFARTAKDFYKDNIYFDVSAIVTLIAGSPIQSEFVWTMRNIGVDHIMLGSDYPKFTLRQSVDALESLDLTRSEKDKIRYQTARKLLTPKESD